MPRNKIEPIEGLYCPSCGEETVRKEGSQKAESGRQRYRCQTCNIRTTKPLKVKPQVLPEFSKHKAERYIITSAVNDTAINKNQLATLETMAGLLDARLIIIGTVYKNPDMVRQGFLETLKRPAAVLPYICQEKFVINKNLVIRGDARIPVTAINPLTGANHAGDTSSEIFGHPQEAMEMVPSPKDDIPKALLTTGTVSAKNYGGSWKAKKAEFHHSQNAIFIEVKGNRFWPTQLPWDGKGIQLFDRYYTPTTSRKAPKLEGVVYGDIHEDELSKKERDNLHYLFKGLKAKKNVLHDLLDFHTGSHHKERNVIANIRNPDFNIRGELNRALNFLRKVPNPVVVSSNHNDHLDQWFNRYDPRRACQNITLYRHLMDLAGRTSCGLFEAYAVNKKVKADFTNPNKAYKIKNIDLAQHGHRGPNGARGSGKSFSKTGHKVIVGHSHTPGIYKGSWQVGTSAMGMEYATGYSSWLVCHACIQASGKRVMIMVIGNQFSPMLKEAIDNNKFV